MTFVSHPGTMRSASCSWAGGRAGSNSIRARSDGGIATIARFARAPTAAGLDDDSAVALGDPLDRRAQLDRAA